jgi:5-methylcytosine-specific restriction endonuclease McrA
MDFNYVELLKNPLWKEKRKAILFRDGKKCTVCGKKTTLEIHHTFYYKDYPAPWCYPNDSLLTVCRDCHRQWHEYNENVIVE